MVILELGGLSYKEGGPHVKLLHSEIINKESSSLNMAYKGMLDCKNVYLTTPMHTVMF